MGFADYYQRSALAASQVLHGFDSEAFEKRLSSTVVGISFTADAAASPEGNHLLDLAVRLVARLYPVLDITAPATAGTALHRMRRIARAINSRIELRRTGKAAIGLAVGDAGCDFGARIYAGSTGWDALISTSEPQCLGATRNPLGAGAAACIACANIFRWVFIRQDEDILDRELVLSTYSFSRQRTPPAIPNEGWAIDEEVALIGVGAIGMASAWALGRAPLNATVHLVDPQEIELGNLQRYVLPTRSHAGAAKVAVARRAFEVQPLACAHQQDWQTFISRHGYSLGYALVAVDSAQARRDAQASLPAWIANAWTQPADLGVSIHPKFGSEWACLACLYLPAGQRRNEDQVVAEALGIPGQCLRFAPCSTWVNQCPTRFCRPWR